MPLTFYSSMRPSYDTGCASSSDQGLSIERVKNLHHMLKTLVGQCRIYLHTKSTFKFMINVNYHLIILLKHNFFFKKTCLITELRTIRTLDNSDLGQFGPQLWTIRTLVNSDLGQFGPRPLVNSDPIKRRSELTNSFLKIGSELTKVRFDSRSELTKVQTK